MDRIGSEFKFKNLERSNAMFFLFKWLNFFVGAKKRTKEIKRGSKKKRKVEGAEKDSVSIKISCFSYLMVFASFFSYISLIIFIFLILFIALCKLYFTSTHI